MNLAVPLPSVVRDELLGVWIQLALAQTDVSAALPNLVLATDATTKWAGVCSCQVHEPEVMAWLWSRRRPKHNNMMYAHEDASYQ
eukprot:4214856-Amphidinium_carterae.2